MSQESRYGEVAREKLHTRNGFKQQNFHKDKPRTWPKPKGHDALLRDLQEAGSLVSFRLMGVDDSYVGKIVARDKFTISVLTGVGDTGEFEKFPTVIYKHALESFKQVPSVGSK